jgi:hypothetical protein
MFIYTMGVDRSNPDAPPSSIVEALGGAVLTILVLCVVYYFLIGRHERQRRREELEAVENYRAIVRKRIEQDREK